MADVVTILTLGFRTADNKNRSVSIQPVRAGATEQMARDLADAMIDSGAFMWAPAELAGATLTQRMTAVLV